MSETPGTRVEWGEAGPMNPGDYAKHPTAGWHATTPNGHGANLSLHDVTEHDDGTITVAPSIRVFDNNGDLWHGYLERGIWREC